MRSARFHAGWTYTALFAACLGGLIATQTPARTMVESVEPFPGPDRPAQPRWRRLGPNGADPGVAAISADGSTAWLTTTITSNRPSEVFVSTDGGRFWRRRASPGAIGELVLGRDGAAWALVDEVAIWRSSDRGRSWTLAYQHTGGYDLRDLTAGDGEIYLRTGDSRFLRLDPDAGNPIELHADVTAAAVGPDGSLWITTNTGLERSRNRGATWVVAGPPIGGSTFWMVVDPSNPDRLYLWRTLGDLNAPLLRSDDGGVHFTAVGPRLTYLQRPSFTTVAMHSRVLTARGWREIASSDHGDSWRPVPGLPVGSRGELAVAAEDRMRLLYVPGGFFALGTLVSDDAGGTWRAGGRGLDAVTVQQVIPPRSGRSRLFALLTPSFDELYAGGHPSLYGNGPVLHGRDPDGHWRRASFQRDLTRAHAATADPVVAGRLWASTHQGLFVSDDAGTRWRLLANPEGPQEATDLVAHPSASNQLFATTLENLYPCGSLRRSMDGGASWHSTNQRLDILSHLVGDRARPRRLMLSGVACSCSRSCEGDEVLAESDDGGRSWSETPAPASTWVPGCTSAGMVPIWSPRGHVALLATGGGLFRRPSDDASWEPVDVACYLDIAAGRRHLYAVTFDPQSGQTRILRSADDGTSWNPLAGGDPQRIEALEVVAGAPDRIYGLGPGVFELLP